MLTLKGIYKLQTDYAVSEGTFNENEITFKDYVDSSRAYLKDNLPPEYSSGLWDEDKKSRYMRDLLSSFVSKYEVKVRGYVSPEGIVDTKMLLTDLINEVQGLSILKYAYDDPDVDEIQINDMYTIFVSKAGRLMPYVDANGRVLQFTSNDEIHTLINRLIDDGSGSIPQFTDGKPLLNAKTAEKDYRMNAVHHSVVTRSSAPHNHPSTAVVLRKFKEVKLTIEDLINSGAITREMGDFILLLGKAEIKLFCVGPTASGKTTLLQIIANTLPINKRILLAQNPTELTFFERDEYNRMLRNVVHMHVSEFAKLEDLASNKLRQSPDVSIIGEMREPAEFAQAHRFMKTGHKMLGSFHAENTVDAVERFASELSATGEIGYAEAQKSVSRLLDIVITQFRFDDGRRRIMEIAEVIGVDNDGEIVVNPIFKFVMTGETRENEFGLKEVLGEFKQVGKLSNRIRDKFYLAGISKDQLKGLIEEDVVTING